MDREARQARTEEPGVTRVGHDLATKERERDAYVKKFILYIYL